MILRFLIGLLYKLELINTNVPLTGRLLVVSNHVSFMDGFLIAVSSPRPLRFIVYYKIYNHWLLNLFFRHTKCIPIAGIKEDRKVFTEAFKEIDKALQNDEAVMIFPEGMITYDGELNDFKSGIEHIIKRTPAPVYSMSITGMYGSYFSRTKNRPLLGKFRSKIQIVGGKLLEPKEVTRHTLFEEAKRLR